MFEKDKQSFSSDNEAEIKGGWWQFLLACVIYLIALSYRVEDFPVYFFCDEAFPSITGLELWKNKLRGSDGTLLPFYFNAASGRWTPVLTVYIYGLASLLWGNSVELARTIAVALSFIGPLCCAMMLRYIFRVRYWWTPILVFTFFPAWVIHARTVFEAIAMCSFYAAFLLFYLLSRKYSSKFLPLAGLFAACTFYTYSNGQLVLAVTVLLIVAFSFRYYLRNWRVFILSALLALLFCIPLINFRLKHGEKFEEHLKTVNSYWTMSIPLTEKLKRFALNYAGGFDPAYWFVPNTRDIERHRLPDYPHISKVIVPFLLLGMIAALIQIKRIEYTVLFISLLAAPVGGALLEVLLLRAIVILIPVALFVSLGINRLISFISPYCREAVISFSIFAGALGYLLPFGYFALETMPGFYYDYGLYGVQYGARQLFAQRIPQYLERAPTTRIIISSTWANGAHLFKEFFLTKEQAPRVVISGPDSYLIFKTEIADGDIFIFTPSDYKKMAESSKIQQLRILETVPYPSGEPGFYIFTARYAENVDAQFALDEVERRKLRTAEIDLPAFKGKIHHSAIDMGALQNILDGDASSLIRGMEANPFVLEIEFDSLRSLKGISVVTNPASAELTLEAFSEAGQMLSSASALLALEKGTGAEARSLNFDKTIDNIKKLRIEIKDPQASGRTNIHIWEVSLN